MLRHAQSLKSLTSAAAVSASLRPNGILCFASHLLGLQSAKSVPAPAAPTCISCAGASELRSRAQGLVYAKEIYSWEWPFSVLVSSSLCHGRGTISPRLRPSEWLELRCCDSLRLAITSLGSICIKGTLLGLQLTI